MLGIDDDNTYQFGLLFSVSVFSFIVYSLSVLLYATLVVVSSGMKNQYVLW